MLNLVSLLVNVHFYTMQACTVLLLSYFTCVILLCHNDTSIKTSVKKIPTSSKVGFVLSQLELVRKLLRVRTF